MNLQTLRHDMRFFEFPCVKFKLSCKNNYSRCNKYRGIAKSVGGIKLTRIGQNYCPKIFHISPQKNLKILAEKILPRTDLLDTAHQSSKFFDLLYHVACHPLNKAMRRFFFKPSLILEESCSLHSTLAHT